MPNIPQITIKPSDKRVLNITLAISAFFFAFLYFSAAYSLLNLFSVLFLAIVTTNVLNLGDILRKSSGAQEPTRIYGELVLAVLIIALAQYFGVALTAFAIGTGLLIFILLVFLRLTQLDNFFGKSITKESKSRITISAIQAVIYALTFIVIFFSASTIPSINSIAVLFTAFILGSLITGDYLDQRKVLADIFIAFIIITIAAQLNISIAVPQDINSLQLALPNLIIIFGLIFGANYLFNRAGLIKAVNQSSLHVG
ncbi:MAG: hypothetical protein KGH62_05340 [Candidatus Micrarchaeota archaeon]|nr:hypothetical protein [Candidatus Micrarchaeota archaeon]